jgi:hypothetical protein
MPKSRKNDVHRYRSGIAIARSPKTRDVIPRSARHEEPAVPNAKCRFLTAKAVRNEKVLAFAVSCE